MSSLPLTPTTELEAVNLLLIAIGETPVTSLSMLTGDAATARTILHETSRNTQAKGLSFNTDEEFPLVPDTNGEVYLPANVVHVDLSDPLTEDAGVIFRGRRAYDRRAHTYRLSRTLKVDIVSLLPWEELPHYARRWVIAQAVLRFIMSAAPDANSRTLWQEEYLDAQVAFEAAEIDVEDPNTLTSAEMLSRTHRRL